jgi:hypothetical protein
MGIVANQFKILELEFVDFFHRRIQFHLRQRTRLARELQLRLLDVVLVEMQIAEGVDEIAGLQAADLRDHQREQRVTRDVERHAQENIRAALVKLAAEFAIAHVKLEQRVARRQRHLPDFTRIPRADNMPPAVGILFDLLDDLVNLIEGPSVGRAPVAPLRTINAAQAAVLVRPFVPDRHAVLVEIFDVGVAAQEPEQLVNDGLGVDFLGREQREIISQIEACLGAKHGIRAGARAVGLELSMFEDMPQQIEVLNHRGENLTTKDAKYTKRNLAAKKARVKIFKRHPASLAFPKSGAEVTALSRNAGLTRLFVVTKLREASGLRRVYRRFQVRHRLHDLTGIEIGSPRRAFVAKLCASCEFSPWITEPNASALR